VGFEGLGVRFFCGDVAGGSIFFFSISFVRDKGGYIMVLATYCMRGSLFLILSLGNLHMVEHVTLRDWKQSIIS
jgi:hypothetical protein